MSTPLIHIVDRLMEYLAFVKEMAIPVDLLCEIEPCKYPVVRELRVVQRILDHFDNRFQ